MSLYNLLHGVNPASPLLLGVLGLTTSDVGRFRDAYLTERDGQRVIAIYTRNGGGNRGCYCEDQGTCTGCVMGDVIPAHPHYLCDEDDDFDCTYATVYYRIPDEYEEALSKLTLEDATPEQRWEGLLEKLQSGDASDPQVKRVTEAMEPVIKAIQGALSAPPAPPTEDE